MTLVHVQNTGLMNSGRNQSEQQPSVCTTASLSSGMNLPQLILPQERCRDAQRCRAGCCGVSGHQDQGKPSPISDHLLGGAYFFPLLQCIQKAFLFIVQTDRIVTSLLRTSTGLDTVKHCINVFHLQNFLQQTLSSPHASSALVNMRARKQASFPHCKLDKPQEIPFSDFKRAIPQFFLLKQF